MSQKITCVQCHHWKNYDKASIANFNEDPESFDCELCHFNHPGHAKKVGFYYACAFCNQVNESDFCNCEESLEANTSTIKIVYDPDKKWMKPNKVNEKEAEGNTTRLFNKIVRNKKLDKVKRDEHIEQLLVKTVDLLTKLVKQKEVKNPV